MLTIGDTFPPYTLKGVISTDPAAAFENFNNQTHKGQWKVIFFWPKDFTFVCPTEIKAFSDMAAQFADRDAQVLGVSTDSEFVHLAWRNNHADLKDLKIPLLSDIRKDLCRELGILEKAEEVALRATFIIDPDEVIRFVSVNDMSVGRNPKEVLRVLDGLQTDELCPCNWEKGDATLHP